MAQKRRFNPNKRQLSRAPADTRMLRLPPEVTERRAPIEYGKPFIVMEDETKQTFIFKGGAWVPHVESIAACRQSCDVKVLPQKLNRMTRYEVRCPVGYEPETQA